MIGMWDSRPGYPTFRVAGGDFHGVRSPWPCGIGTGAVELVRGHVSALGELSPPLAINLQFLGIDRCNEL